MIQVYDDEQYGNHIRVMSRDAGLTWFTADVDSEKGTFDLIQIPSDIVNQIEAHGSTDHNLLGVIRILPDTMARLREQA